MTITLQDVASLAAIAAAVITLLGFWVKFSGEIGKAKQTAETATLRAEAAHIRIGQQEEKFNDYRVEAAKEFLISDDLTAAENRMTEGMRDVKMELAEMTKRFDRLLEKVAPPG
jgi:hypothetical protein